eukprot:5950059-Amphidinium_carterae.1
MFILLIFYNLLSGSWVLINSCWSVARQTGRASWFSQFRGTRLSPNSPITLSPTPRNLHQLLTLLRSPTLL